MLSDGRPVHCSHGKRGRDIATAFGKASEMGGLGRKSVTGEGRIDDI